MYTRISSDASQYLEDMIQVVAKLAEVASLVAFAAAVPLIGSYLLGG